MFTETAACALQMLFGFNADEPRVGIVSTNGRTVDGHTFMHFLRCAYPSGFDPSKVHKYTIHWNGTEVVWAVDGLRMHSLTDARIAQTCS